MESWTVRLKNEREVKIRFLSLDDKKKIIQLFVNMSDEALQWGMPPYTKEVIERWLNNINSSIPLIAEFKNQLVGYSSIFINLHPRRKHTSSLIIYLHQDFHNIGLGSIILNLLLTLGQERGLHRVGLHVISDNEIAIHLYKKFGFKVEGIMRESYFGIDGKYHDEVVMGIILNH